MPKESTSHILLFEPIIGSVRIQESFENDQWQELPMRDVKV